MNFPSKFYPPPSVEKKHLFFTIFFMSLLCLLSPNLARTLKKKLISASFKMFRTKKLKLKSPTDSRDFCPDPPVIKNKSLHFSGWKKEERKKITTRLRKVGTVWTHYFTMSWFPEGLPKNENNLSCSKLGNILYHPSARRRRNHDMV